MNVGKDIDYLDMAEVTWEKVRTLLSESTRFSSQMNSNLGWLPIFWDLKKHLTYLVKKYPEYQEWLDWIEKERAKEDLDWSYFIKNDEYVNFKYALEELVKSKRVRDEG